MGASLERVMVWPPTVLQQSPLGIMRDDTGNWIPRDIGRSSQFSNGHVVVQFGDTFEHDIDGKFLGVIENTCAVITDPKNPTVSTYPEREAGHVPVFIQQYSGEFPVPAKFWSFSGIVESFVDQGGIIHGYTWFKITRMKGLEEDYIRMGMAKVEYNPATKYMYVLRVPSDSETINQQPKPPSWGYLCALRVGDWIYLYGQDLDTNKKKVIYLSRFPVLCEKGPTTYWTETGWSTTTTGLKPILSNVEHGQIFPTTAFGFHSTYKYLFVGSSSTGDSRAIIARAQTPEGPWDDPHTLPINMYNSNPNVPPTGPFYYCVYPHPWALAFNKEGLLRSGDLMVSWSEGGIDGHVLAASLRFQMEVRPVDDPIEGGG